MLTILSLSATSDEKQRMNIYKKLRYITHQNVQAQSLIFLRGVPQPLSWSSHNQRCYECIINIRKHCSHELLYARYSAKLLIYLQQQLYLHKLVFFNNIICLSRSLELFKGKKKGKKERSLITMHKQYKSVIQLNTSFYNTFKLVNG